MISRATDPGQRLFQYLTDCGQPVWVHCPRCGGPARDTGRRLACLRCGYDYGAKAERPRRGGQMTLNKWSPACASCGGPIPRLGRAVRTRPDEPVLAEVKCPTCAHVGRYPATAGASTRVWHPHRPYWPMRRSPYLAKRIGAETLWVYNRDHLEALEAWLGATLRERGPVAGLTMMARLPRWMKAASARPRVLKALAELRAQAEKEGLW